MAITHDVGPEAQERQASLFRTLDFLAGHFDMASTTEEGAVTALQQELAGALGHDDLDLVRSRFFSVDSSDLFLSAASPQRSRLWDLAGRMAAEVQKPEHRVFVRDTPARATQIPGTVPDWGVGAVLAKTLGPFEGKDGRRFWFDFFTVLQLTALYVQGRPGAAILFDVALPKQIVDGTLPPVVEPRTEYQLLPDTVWIDAGLLAAGAPADVYAGLKIKNGTIALSEPPQLIGGKLTLPSTATASISLELDTGAGMVVDPGSSYGADAREATLQLPQRLAFHFTGAPGVVDAVEGHIEWNLYGRAASFAWAGPGAVAYEPLLDRILIPLNCASDRFGIERCASPLVSLAGEASIERSGWALPLARVDVVRPSPAAGIGGLAIRTLAGLSARWQGLRGGAINLANPWLLCEPGRINITEGHAGNVFCTQEYRLWKDELNSYGSSVKLHYTDAFMFGYAVSAGGDETFMAQADANPQLDRPVTASGQALRIQSKATLILVSANKTLRLLYLYDDNIRADYADPNNPQAPPVAPLAIAMRNALFKITPVKGCLLFGALAEDMQRVERGTVSLTFGMFAYVPTLPDPYAVNLGLLQNQFEDDPGSESQSGEGRVSLLLVAQTRWWPLAPDRDKVEVSFHFAPLKEQLALTAGTAAGQHRAPAQAGSPAHAIVPALARLSSAPFLQLLRGKPAAAPTAAAARPQAVDTLAAAGDPTGRGPDYQDLWNDRFAYLQDEDFSLIDVSSNANQMGVSFEWSGRARLSLVRTHEIVPVDAGETDANFPLQMRGLDVTARAVDVRAFTPPVVSWEPVINLTPPESGTQDPPEPVNYYPDDGGPTKIFNNSSAAVPIAPIPVCDMLVDAYGKDEGNITSLYFTLPFGMRAFAHLSRADGQQRKPTFGFNRPSFGDLEGGLQLKFVAGSSGNPGEDDMFRGYTAQMDNVLGVDGSPTGTTTLGEHVSAIFNSEFFGQPNPGSFRGGVPLKRIDISGLGATTFSDWRNPDAAFAATSQARFDVVLGRTAREVVQVRSILYPWGIRVVRTVTLFREASGYVYRVDSGWKAERDGRFDFSFKFLEDPTKPANKTKVDLPYKVHPGVIKGLYNVQNIRTDVPGVLPYKGMMDVAGFYVMDDATGMPVRAPANPPAQGVDLEPVYFDADVELEGAIQGQVGGRVPARKILGFVQIAPRGIPLTPAAFHALLQRQLGAIGGPLDCVIDIGRSGQMFRVNQIDVNASFDADGATPVFAGAVRGQPVLAKEGAWTIVSHARATGDVTPLPDNVSVPLVRAGELRPDLSAPDQALLRIANPADLLRAPGADTINFGFLQSTGTQKTLFLTPAFAKQASAALPGKLLSKVPPLFVDAYRVAGSKAVFPNIGDAESSFGAATALNKGFTSSALVDGGKQVLELLNINSADGVHRLTEEGYKLASAVKNFEPPTGPWHLIDEDYLKIYVQYQTTTTNADAEGKQIRAGSLDYDLDSFAADTADRWKSRMNNMEMVVDLGPFPRLLTVKGVFDAKKGAEAGFVGDAADPDFSAPQLELSDALKEVKDILQILAALQGGDYADAVKRGLKIAMSNRADSWDYRLEASQEIPVLKFPPPLADSPNSPLRLQASLKFGLYFNSAVGVAALSDPKQLLPSAGAFLEFSGRLSVMCVSISLATVYAVGQCDLRIAGDTKVGPSIRMKFGFGAQIVVGLPAVGNVAVMYVVGVELYLDANTMSASAFLMYQGHAELFAGLVSVTIMIEAKGSVKRIGDQTLCAAQVTFGLDISVFLVIDIHFSTAWEEQRQIA